MIIGNGRWLLSLKEVAAIVGVAEKDVRNEVAKRIIVVPYREPRGERSSLRFDLHTTFCFYVVHRSPLPIPTADRISLYRLICSREAENGPWKRVHNGVCHSGSLTLWLDTIFPLFRDEMLAYRRGARRTESHPQVLGGEPVFRGTRISVRHVGSMAVRGVPTEEILADFPALGPADVAFARIVAAMKPDPGRPAKTRLRFTRLPTRVITKASGHAGKRHSHSMGRS